MITPISNNLANTFSAIERPRIPGRMHTADSISFTGKFSPSKAVSGIKGKFVKVFNSIRNGTNNLIHSKPVQAVKNSSLKISRSSVNVIKSIPKAIDNFLADLQKNFQKKHNFRLKEI